MHASHGLHQWYHVCDAHHTKLGACVRVVLFMSSNVHHLHLAHRLVLLGEARWGIIHRLHVTRICTSTHACTRVVHTYTYVHTHIFIYVCLLKPGFFGGTLRPLAPPPSTLPKSPQLRGYGGNTGCPFRGIRFRSPAPAHKPRMPVWINWRM